jgi:hypothetical protein
LSGVADPEQRDFSRSDAFVGNHPIKLNEPTQLGPGALRTMKLAAIVGLAGLAAALVSGVVSAGGYRRFLFSYLVAFVFALTVALGALVFVLLQHLTRAGWSVTVRRTAEAVASTLPVLGVLSIPLLVSVATQNGSLYRWALPMSAAHAESADHHASPAPHAAGSHGSTAHDKHGDTKVDPPAASHDPAKLEHPVLDALTLKKRAWLNPAFFIVRVLVYFGVWSCIALWYRRQSLLQDRTGDVAITHRMEWWAPLSVIAVAVTATGAAFDLVMSLDPHWYSTIFGVYFLAGAFVASFATLILAVLTLQRAGYLRQAVGIEHYHDLGKYLFGFVFFWGYIAFSQYMLLWYANIPEETLWFARHGATTVHADISGWSYLAVAILAGHLLIPFAGLLSRHVKRKPAVLAFWAAWLLLFHYLDLYWVIMPETGSDLAPHLADIAAAVGVAGVMVAVVLKRLVGESLVPAADPRLPEALAFQNI